MGEQWKCDGCGQMVVDADPGESIGGIITICAKCVAEEKETIAARNALAEQAIARMMGEQQQRPEQWFPDGFENLGLMEQRAWLAGEVMRLRAVAPREATREEILAHLYGVEEALWDNETVFPTPRKMVTALLARFSVVPRGGGDQP